ncbi:MAG: hypothetical protein ACRD9L_06385, partial [Bryobacteraceae bacterium]
MRIHAVLLFALGASLAMAQAPVVANGGILNGASFQKGQAITPGSLISIFGTNLAATTAQADSIPLSASLGGVTVQFVNGSTTVNAPMLYAQPDDPSKGITSQLNVQVPWGIVPAGTSATVNVIVMHDGVTSQPASVEVAPFSPGVFSSGGRAIATSQDGKLAWPAGVIPGLDTHPVKPGDAIIIYATGLGAVDVPVADGQNSLDQLRHTVTPPMVLVGG